MQETTEILESLDFLKGRILDIGCGHGMLADYLKDAGFDGLYYGLDVRAGIIMNNIEEWKDDDRFSFMHLDVYNPVYSKSGVQAEEMRLPFLDDSFDSVICHSLFTHIETKFSAQRYMDEITRVLATNGNLWTTWFRSPPNNINVSAYRSVLKESDIMNLLIPYRTVFSCGGLTLGYHDQWQIGSVKR